MHTTLFIPILVIAGLTIWLVILLYNFWKQAKRRDGPELSVTRYMIEQQKKIK